MDLVTGLAWPLVLLASHPTGRGSLVAVQTEGLANGTSIVRARVDLQGQDQPVLLNRFIDLHPDGPRI